MIRFKQGVSSEGLVPQALHILDVAEKVYDSYDLILVVTSGKDGKHKDGSLHYKGQAVDLRTRQIAQALKLEIVVELKARLGKDYDVILETDPEHIHVEYDPKGIR